MGWLVGWLVGGLVGWLVGFVPSCFSNVLQAFCGTQFMFFFVPQKLWQKQCCFCLCLCLSFLFLSFMSSWSLGGFLSMSCLHMGVLCTDVFCHSSHCVFVCLCLFLCVFVLLLFVSSLCVLLCCVCVFVCFLVLILILVFAYVCVY